MTKHTRKVLSQNETLDLFMILSHYCVKSNDMAVYAEGWNDERVAQESGIEGVHSGHVEAMRLRRIGRTAEETRPAPAPQSDERDRALRLQLSGHVTALQLQLERIEGWLGRLDTKLGNLDGTAVDTVRRIDALGRTVDDRMRSTVSRLEDISNSLTDLRSERLAGPRAQEAARAFAEADEVAELNRHSAPEAAKAVPEWPNF